MDDLFNRPTIPSRKPTDLIKQHEDVPVSYNTTHAGYHAATASPIDFALSARSPATVAASTLGPAAVAVLALCGYDTSGLNARRDVAVMMRTLEASSCRRGHAGENGAKQRQTASGTRAAILLRKLQDTQHDDPATDGGITSNTTTFVLDADGARTLADAADLVRAGGSCTPALQRQSTIKSPVLSPTQCGTQRTEFTRDDNAMLPAIICSDALPTRCGGRTINSIHPAMSPAWHALALALAAAE